MQWISPPLARKIKCNCLCSAVPHKLAYNTRLYYKKPPALGLHSLRKSQRFTVNMAFILYKSGFLTVNLHISHAWRLPPPRLQCGTCSGRKPQKWNYGNYFVGMGLPLMDKLSNNSTPKSRGLITLHGHPNTRFVAPLPLGCTLQQDIS